MKNITIIEAKKPVKNTTLFKRRATSVIAFIMSRHFLFLIAAIVLIGIAACSKPEEQVSEPDSASQIEPTIEQDTAGTDSGPDLIQTLRDNAGVIETEDRAIIVERARNNAKDAALAVGQTELQAEDAAQAAAMSAQDSLKAREIP